MKIKTTWLAVLAAVAALASAQTGSAASPPSRYTVTDLGTLPGLADSYLISQHKGNNRAFLLTPSTTSELSATDLNVYVSHVTATKTPPTSEASLWSSKAKLVVTYHPQSNGGLLLPPRFEIGWSVARGADHYRLTVLKKVGHDYVVAMDTSPVAYRVDYDGLAYLNGFCFVEAGRTYLITLTAYSGPDEDVAYSESLQGRITAR